MDQNSDNGSPQTQKHRTDLEMLLMMQLRDQEQAGLK